MIPIVKVIKDAFQEYEGEHALVVFCKHCNLDCEFCHNKASLNTLEVIGDAREIIEANLNPMHTAVVLLGGEFLHYDLSDILELCFWLKDIGMKVKLYTNGMYPEHIEALLFFDCLDSVAIDFKQFDKDVINMGDNESYLTILRKSLKILKNSGINTEVRTTLYHGMDKEELNKILNEVKNVWKMKHLCQHDVREK